MKFRQSIFLILFFMFAGAIVFGQGNSSGKTENELKSLLKQMAEAQINYDQTTLNRIFSSDYIEISPAGEFDPREKVLGFYSPEAKAKDGSPQGSVETADFSIRIYDKFAIVIERITFLTKIEGQPARPPLNMRVTAICRKEKGSWKIASAQFTVIKTP